MNYEYSFYNDYSEGAHPRILDALAKSNLEQESGYGEDSHSLRAAELIKDKIQGPASAVHFVSGGTQANLIALASMLKPYEAVISANTGHINIHEAGAIETTGHKIISVESKNGKLTAEQIQQVVDSHTDEHMVKPKAIFVSNATELGTIYSKSELAQLSSASLDNDLYLYLDGARLGAALTAKGNDLTLADIARLTDAFYIGGTKNGALLGEAIVINDTDLQKDFRYNMKQRGGLLAKGRILGVQFEELFSDNLYSDLAQHANTQAQKMADEIKKMGYGFLAESPTNQIFPILPNSIIEKLSEKYGFYVWSGVDDKSSAIRLVTSWATPEKKVEDFLSFLTSLS